MTNFRPTGKISFNQQFTHNVSPIPGMDKLSPFFLVFGRHAPSPETFTLQLALPSKSLSQQTYVENQVSRLSDAKKEFDRIKADLQWSQQERYDHGLELCSLPRHQAFVSAACKTIYQTTSEPLVSKCPYSPKERQCSRRNICYCSWCSTLWWTWQVNTQEGVDC